MANENKFAQYLQERSGRKSTTSSMADGGPSASSIGEERINQDGDAGSAETTSNSDDGDLPAWRLHSKKTTIVII